jgi:hypothetical protein
MRSFNLLTREEGFTFNEILVSMSIIAVAILGYSVGTAGLIRAGLINSNFTIAVNLAQDKMEQLKGHDDVTDIDNCPDAGERAITASGGAGGIFSRCWQVNHSSLGTKLKQLTVRVSWQDYERREVTLTTLVFTASQP